MAPVLTLIFFCSCKKTKENPSLPVFNAFVAASARYNDTTSVFLAAVGHTTETACIKLPKHAVYDRIVNDATAGLKYYYSPEKNFTGTDTVMFKSIEPWLKKMLISTYYFTTR